MQRFILNILLMLSIALMLSFCSSSTDSNSGRLKILLTDAPANYNSVMVYFSEISAHIDSGWVNVMTGPKAYNIAMGKLIYWPRKKSIPAIILKFV